MNHYSWKDISQEQLGPLLFRRVVHTDRLTLAHFHLKKGCVIPLHSHENEQVSTVLEGSMRFEAEGQQKVVSAGESIRIPPNVPHSAEVIEDTIALDVFSPPRADWKRGDDAYLRKKAATR